MGAGAFMQRLRTSRKDLIFKTDEMMKLSKVVEQKYRGYLIKPALSGFRVYRKGYYIAEYASVSAAKARIDHVVEKHRAATASTPEDPPSAKPKSGQLDLF